ncbi:MAG TPA: hypothetical protein PLM17_02430 [Thauera aminoaromatica]|nr:hypothetical protein [Thauera aminoaromatica]
MPAPEPLLPSSLQPRRVILFSGHMIDAPGRAEPRFPPALAPAAAARIAEALDRLEAGPLDLGLTQGAAGGDLLFAEAAQARALPLLFLQPFGEDEFIARSVRPVSAGEQWVARYRAVAARLASPPHAMLPAPAAAADNPFERCNRWLLDTALACGGERVWLLCLWDGRRGDGAGGTAHMVEEVSRHRGHVLHIDTRELRPHDPAGSPPLLD